MKAPNTYTKEDVVEIDCHGGILVTKKVLETLLDFGAVLAEPGEFTKRAFFHIYLISSSIPITSK